MSLDNPQIVDFLGTRRDRSAVVLTLVDDWDWTDEMRHLRALQRKLDAYFAFIASGELLAAYPDAVGSDIEIELIASLPIPKPGRELLEVASELAEGLSARLSYQVVADVGVRTNELN